MLTPKGTTAELSPLLMINYTYFYSIYAHARVNGDTYAYILFDKYHHLSDEIKMISSHLTLELPLKFSYQERANKHVCKSGLDMIVTEILPRCIEISDASERYSMGPMRKTNMVITILPDFRSTTLSVTHS